MPRYSRLAEVAERLRLDDDLLEAIIDLELIRPKHTLDGEPVLDARGCDELRVALLLLRDLDVNLPGIQVILHMRRRMVEMQRQVGDILRYLREEMREELREAGRLGPPPLLEQRE